MLSVRIIPRLDVKGPNLVKGINLEGLRVLGKPEKFSQHYYQSGADELLYMDVVASLYGRNNILEMVKNASKKVFIPITVGGGLRAIEDIKNVLSVGADKVALNTAAIKDPNLISELSNAFGSSTIVVSIEAIEQLDGSYQAFYDNGREASGKDAVEWAKEATSLGAGEVLITSVDKEGLGRGYDHKLTKNISDAVTVPVIASGGAGSSEHVLDLIKNVDVSGVGLASILHYKALDSLISEDDDYQEGNLDHIKRGGRVSSMRVCSIPDLKKTLKEGGVLCRNL